MRPRTPTAAVVLAAGGGSRFRGGAPGTGAPRGRADPSAGHKLLVPFRGRPLAAWAVAAAAEAGCDETVVVTGAVDLSGLVPPGTTVLANPGWRDGIATSLAVAIDHADAAGHAAVVVGLADQPLVPAGAWRAVAGASAPIAVATYRGARRNPVRLAREVWPLLPRTGDEGARVVVRQRPDLVEEVACEGDPGDVDTVEDLRQWS